MHTIYFQDVSNSDFRPISLEWPIYIKVWGQQYIDLLIYWFIYLFIYLIEWFLSNNCIIYEQRKLISRTLKMITKNYNVKDLKCQNDYNNNQNIILASINAI